MSDTQIATTHRDDRDRWSVPSILTPSFRVNASHFGENIRSLEAVKSTKRLHTRREGDLYENYGYKFTRHDLAESSLSYESEMVRSGDRSYPSNPLDDEAVEAILDDAAREFDPVPDGEGGEHPPDLTIREMSVDITDPEVCQTIRDATTSESDRFTLRFVSSPATGIDDVSEETKEADRTVGIYVSGGNYRNLNLCEVSEPAPINSTSTRRPLFKWNGEDDTDPLRPSAWVEVSLNIFRGLLPEQYRLMKYYSVVEGERAECISTGR